MQERDHRRWSAHASVLDCAHDTTTDGRRRARGLERRCAPRSWMSRGAPGGEGAADSRCGRRPGPRHGLVGGLFRYFETQDDVALIIDAYSSSARVEAARRRSRGTTSSGGGRGSQERCGPGRSRTPPPRARLRLAVRVPRPQDTVERRPASPGCSLRWCRTCSPRAASRCRSRRRRGPGARTRSRSGALVDFLGPGATRVGVRGSWRGRGSSARRSSSSDGSRARSPRARGCSVRGRGCGGWLGLTH